MTIKATPQHIKLVADIMQSVMRIPRWKSSDMRDEMALLVAKAEYNSTKSVLSENDEQSSRLLSALETIARECNCPAHQIALDTLEMHKAWLTTRKDA